MKVTGLNHVGLTVANIERSVEHYCGLLGLCLLGIVEDSSAQLRQVMGLPSARMRFADLALPDGRILELIEFLEPRSGQSDSDLATVGTAHVSIEVEDIDRAYQELLAASVVVQSGPVTLEAPGSIWHGARIFYSLDPDGRTVELIEPAPIPG